MENASKALLIAAAVLIGILIITVSLSILNSTNGVGNSADKVGEIVSSETTDASKDAISSLKDITSRNLINVKDKDFKSNIKKHYSSTATGFYIEPGKKYELQFDYDIKSADYTVYCGIGVIKEGYYLYPDYSMDIDSLVNYPNQKKGTFKHTFSTGKKISKPMELGIRVVRMKKAREF